MNEQLLKIQSLVTEMWSQQHPFHYLVKDKKVDFVYVQALDEVLKVFKSVFAFFEQNSGTLFCF